MNKEEVLKDIDHYGDIENVAKTKGGEKIINGLKEDVIGAIDSLSNYKEMSHIELVACSAKLSNCMDMLRLFQNAETNKKLAKKELESILEVEKEEVE